MLRGCTVITPPFFCPQSVYLRVTRDSLWFVRHSNAVNVLVIFTTWGRHCSAQAFSVSEGVVEGVIIMPFNQACLTCVAAAYALPNVAYSWQPMHNVACSRQPRHSHSNKDELGGPCVAQAQVGE